jgi:hypothetical protein
MTFDVASQTLAGDTLAIDPPLDPRPLAPPTDEAVDSTPTPSSTTAPVPTSGSTPGHLPAPAGRRPKPGSQAASPPPALYGAIGEHLATDLATTFTRAFPQAASADAVWSSVSFGGAGRADVKLVLDETGHIVDSDTTGAPSPALRRSIQRTVALLAPRSFTARAAITRLRVAAHVSHDDIHDGLHGDVFALSAGSFFGEVGTAFFALPQAAGAGRRVDVEVRLLP